MRKPQRVFGYARVSSLEQSLGTSLQDQQDVIRAYAQARGLKVNQMFVEAESAVHERFERREQIQSLMAEVRADDLILVDKLDRWSRDPAFTYTSIRQIISARASFYAVGDQCDPSTYEGDTMLNVRVLVAREEHKRIKQRMVGTRKLLRDRGYYVEGLPPWGYKRQAVKGVQRNVLVVDENNAEKVRQVFRLCIAGDPLTAIGEKIGIARDRVHDIIHSRAYLGEVRDSRFNWVKGHQAALIDADTFLRAQEALTSRRHGARFHTDGALTASWWLRDIARCGLCGAKMSAAYGGRADRKVRRYYFFCYARCTSRFVRVTKAEEQCEPLVVARLTDLRAQLASWNPTKPAIVDTKALEDRRAKLQRRRERFLEAFADGHMDRDELRVAMAKLDTARTKVDASERVIAPASRAQARAALAEVRGMCEAWDLASPSERREVVAGLAKSVGLAADQAPAFAWFSTDEIIRRGT